jgi:glycine/D-amino acid oxidase-like deaminating enzyme
MIITTNGQTTTTHFDVLIVGTGISGIGAAAHLKTRRPGTSFAVLEGRDSIGGAWSLFQYPGIRSDSDMPTFGYSFNPWTHCKSIADGNIIGGASGAGERGLAGESSSQSAQHLAGDQRRAALRDERVEGRPVLRPQRDVENADVAGGSRPATA